MEARPTIHPSIESLRALALGKLNDSTASAVLSHLESCPDCRREVASATNDDFLNRLRQIHERGGTPAPAKSLAEAGRSSQPASRSTILPNLPPELAANAQYEVLRELGRGGMGVVYLAKNKLLQRLEVLKVVNKALLDHPDAAERFLREIRSAARLKHDNVVKAYQALQMGEVLAFSMEYIEGADLAKLVKSQGPLPVSHACVYARQVALGLQHAFEKGMVHRDIKPQNLILSREGDKDVVKILDFGLAKATREKREDSSLTGRGAMLGTPDYIAPEQTLDAAQVDIRADIYSLGCTLYHLLAGAPPFQGKSMFEIMQAHHSVEAKPLNSVREEVPAELATVVRKMMAKDRHQRYQTPAEVAQALSVFVAQPMPPRMVPVLSVQPATAGSMRKSPPIAALSSVAGATRSYTGETPIKRTWRKKWPIGGIVVGTLLFGVFAMWAGGVFKVKMKDGTIVLENLPADADVLVDGEKVTVTWGDDGETAQITVKPGTHKIVAIRGGIKVIGEEVEIDSGGRKAVRMRIEESLSSATSPGNGNGSQKRNADHEQGSVKQEAGPPSKYAGRNIRWVKAFDGKSLAGWSRTQTETTTWAVLNGSIVGIGDNKGSAGSLVYTPQDISDCVIRAKVSGVSCGIMFRGANCNQLYKGYYVSIHPGDVGALREFNPSLRPAWPTLALAKQYDRNEEDLLDLEILVEGMTITVWVNGQEVVKHKDTLRRYERGGIALRCNKWGKLLVRQLEIGLLPKKT